MTFPRRFLTSFGPKDTPHLFTDILVIGAGIAGVRAALEVPPDLRVLLVTKGRLEQSNSAWAQGGIAGVLAPEDRFENHIEDTHAAGAGLCNPDVVQRVVREGPKQINDLIRFGTRFDMENGQLALTREGGHSHRRIVHALGDATGAEVMRAMIDYASKQPNIILWDRRFIIDLLTHEGCCVGALINRPRRGKLSVWAKQTILASGGAGLVFRETTNPPVATGDGIAAAYRAGARLRDMEFMQFHPTVLYLAGSARHLISEAVRGEGAYLRDKHGNRFMFQDLPEEYRALCAATEEEGRRFVQGGDTTARRPPELSPRDVVARAIVRCMDRTQHPSVYLDLSHLPPERVMQRFPGIAKVCRGFGLDITRDPIPVRPGAHYMVGGVMVDAEGRTSLPGLWAAGEVTSSGLHGANRLASNSLLEGLVYGASCGRGAAACAEALPDRFVVPPVSSRVVSEGDEIDVGDVTNSLRSLMVRKMGIVRDCAGLGEAERTVSFWGRYALGHEFDTRAGWELQNLLTIARLMIWSALQRTESRGTHYRSDFPERDDTNWRKHLQCPAELPETPVPPP